MAEKQRFNISLPEHVAEELARRAKLLGGTPTEYAADIIRWWFGEGSPPLSAEEKRVIQDKGGVSVRRAS